MDAASHAADSRHRRGSGPRALAGPLLILAILSAPMAMAQSHPGLKNVATPTGTLLDGSFESGTPSAFWNEFSVTFVTPICNLQVCGNGNNTSLPRSGDFWVWFGGAAGLMEFGFVDQEVILPVEETIVSFYLWNGSFDPAGDDAFEFGVDGDVLVTVVEGDEDFTDGYARVAADITDYADGGTHVLFFRATDFDGDNTSFALDDISINGPVTGPVFAVPVLGADGILVIAALLCLVGLLALRNPRRYEH